MTVEKKLKDPVVLFASIEREQHEVLRALSFQRRRSIADLTREAIEKYLSEEQALKSKTSKAERRAEQRKA